jgi:hypothetical protein
MPRKRRRKASTQPIATRHATSARAVQAPLPRLPVIEAANLGVRFALEMASLLILGIAGFEATDNALRWVLAIGAPGIAALIWGALVSPKAPSRLSDPQRLSVEIVYFGSATVALVSLGTVPAAFAFASIASSSLILMFRFNQRGL